MNGDGKGWFELCKDFFYRCQGILDDSWPVGRIILAGGASNMYFVEDICREVFKKEPEHEILPYHCVSEGLCQVAKNLFNIDQILHDEMQILKNEGCGFSRVISEHISEKIQNYLFKELRFFIQNQPPVKLKYWDLLSLANKHMSRAIGENKSNKSELFELIKEDLIYIKDNMSKQYQKEAAEHMTIS